jgi:HAD superfamily hydrolase (TIGR01509 family)
MRPVSLLLELEGIVADTIAARRLALAEALAAIGRALLDDEIAHAADGHAAARAASIAARALSLDTTDEELIALRADRAFEERVGRGVSLIPGAREAVQTLAARLRIVVVTRAPSRAADRILALGDLDSVVAGVVAAEHVLAPKPSPSGHARALGRLARVGAGEPGRVVAFEDAPDGIAAARDAGVLAVGVGPGARDASEADAWLASLAGVNYDAVVQLLENRGDRGA